MITKVLQNDDGLDPGKGTAAINEAGDKLTSPEHTGNIEVK